MAMKLEDLDFEDDELDVLSDPNLDQEDEELEKPWMTGSDFDQEPLKDDDDDDDIEDGGDEDVLTSFLRSKGINPESVKMQNEKGEVEEKNFNDLTREEQLQILGYDDSQDNYGLEDEEINMVNFMRQNHMSINDYNNYIANQAIQNYISSNQNQQQYEIDDISDDDLFILDLKAKVQDITDEEAVAELTNAKQNQSLYEKRMAGMRADYKQREDALIQQEQAEQQAIAQKQAQEYETLIVDTLKKNDSIDLGDSSITFSEDDMNEIASFILDSDKAGVRHIAKALNDPKTLIGMSWYALHGQETFGKVADYYKSKITEAARYNYQKGYEDARNGKRPNSTKTTTVKRLTPKQQSQQPRLMTINDLD